jgi:hypothetical protein
MSGLITESADWSQLRQQQARNDIGELKAPQRTCRPRVSAKSHMDDWS